MSSFESGTLVEIVGLPVDKSVEPGKGGPPVDLNGQRAQLLRYDREAQKWTMVTFSGITVSLDPKYLMGLHGSDLKGYDFVLGPKSDLHTLAAELCETLGEKGYAMIKLFMTEEDASEMLEVASYLDENEYFGRLAVEFERGYLGVDGYAKTLLLDPNSDEAPDNVRKSPLTAIESNFAALTELLDPWTLDRLGYRLYSRSSMLLQMPIGDDEDEKYQAADIEDGDAEGYLQTMVRKKLTLMQFVGPATGSLTLVPRSGQGPSVQLTAEPHTLLVLADTRYEYSLEMKKKALTLSTFLLAQPIQYTLSSLPVGDLEVLGVLGTGPPPPPPKQCAVDGMYCRYGTGAEGRDKFWCGVNRASTDGLTDVPFVRWDMSYYYHPEGLNGASYTHHGCFGIEGVELFDNRFFEISPGEAKGMDPCQRQVLEVSYMSLVEGGWDKKMLQKKSENIGHFVGIDKDDWMCMGAAGLLDFGGGGSGAAAAANAITSNRFSYLLNLKGASMTIDTACSSSLVCTHVAKLHLRFKDAEEMPAAIVNGINLMLYQGPFCGCSQAGMLSHKGRSFTFAASADGYARGELSGAVIMKLKDYKKESDSILACIAGSQANQDGRSASMTAPNGPAQEKCIASVLSECKLTPTEVDLFECHGTGTSLGDPIEVGAFKKVMMATPRERPLMITSSKSNIAHAEGGAGLAGIIKICLQVMHCEGSSTVHLNVRNPHLDMEGFPCWMLTEGAPCAEDGANAGVSGFGFGGTNAHADAWGRNIMTSRGGRLMDLEAAFKKKLAMAPPAEITISGDDIMEWETTGPDPRAEPGTNWKVDIDEDGTVTMEPEDDDMKDLGYEFYLQGTHNNWALQALERDESIDGLWVGQIEISDSPIEEFQIVADKRMDMIYHPATARCTRKSAEVKGPDEVGSELSWMVRGQEGDVFRIEFFQRESYTAVWWVKK